MGVFLHCHAPLQEGRTLLSHRLMSNCVRDSKHRIGLFDNDGFACCDTAAGAYVIALGAGLVMAYRSETQWRKENGISK